MRPITIAIDGFSSCGKSTLAKQLAERLGYAYIDSGAMYRAVALFGREHGLIADDRVDRVGLIQALGGIDIRFQHDGATGRSATFLNGRNVEQQIRGMAVSRDVTLVSPIPEVRSKLVGLQQAMGRGGGVVMDGRDIGTVVFPHAEVKLFMTARPDVRAQRRFAELRAKGQDVTLEEVAANIRRRDQDDTTRAADPLRKADDAVVIDNSDLSPEEQLALALGIVERALAASA
ncbi:MAG: (d)CMP kinase [Flavobacteriales bacterium]